METDIAADVTDESDITYYMRIQVAAYESMIADANGIIRSSISPTKRAYWRGRRDVYEAELISCKMYLGIDLLIEGSK